MMRLFDKWLPLRATMLAVALLLVATSPARASLVLVLSDNAGHTATATDSPANPGAVAWSGTLGNFKINMTSAFGNPVLGAPNVAELDLTDVSITSSTGGGGTLHITAYETGYQLPSNAPVGGFLTSIGGTISTGGTISAVSYFDSSNTGNSATLPSFQAPGGAVKYDLGQFGGVPFSGYVGGSQALSGSPFALINQVTVSLGNSQSVSFDIDTTVSVPAPPGMLLALSGAPVLALGCWWKRRQSPKGGGTAHS
jgi:hypothetical protein